METITKSKLLEQRDNMLSALREISKAEGVYSMDRLEHATNVIKNMKSIADKAII